MTDLVKPSTSKDTTMKAIVCEKYGSPGVLKLQEVERPAPAEGEVLIRVHASSVNPYDWHFMTGQPYVMRLQIGLRKPKDPILGADMAGQIEAVGANVKHFKPGDEVFGEVPGAFAEYVCASEDRIALKPKNLTYEQAAAVPMTGLTALQALRDKGDIQSGQKVLINGASGGIGTLAVQIAKSYGAEVTAVCSTQNVEQARSLGADHVIDYSKDDFAEGGRSYDLIVDNVGNRRMADFKKVLTPDGTYVAAGGPKGRRPGTGPFAFIAKVLVGSMVGSQKMKFFMARINNEDLAFLGGLIEAEKVTPVIERTYALDETADAVRKFGEGHARGKTVITM